MHESEKRVLDEFRRSIEPAPDLRRAHWEHLERAIAEGREPAGLESSRQGGARAARRAGVVWVLAAVASIAAGLLLGLRLGPWHARSAEEIRSDAQAVAELESTKDRATSPGTERAVDSPSTRPAERKAASEPDPPSRRPRAQPSAADDRLAAELALVRAAKQSLLRGEPGEALRTLAVHEARFPAGMLEPERRATEVRALCALGRAQEAAFAAEAFLAAHPDARVAQALVARACPDAARKTDGAADDRTLGP